MAGRHRDPVVEWLLSPDNPSVRLLTLTDILGQRPGSAQVRAARRAVMERGPVPAILERQLPDGGWVKATSMYHAKYRGTVWQLLLLAELGADPADERVARACDHVLEHSWSSASGGFSTRVARTGGGSEESVIACLTGNMVFGLARLGRLGDERVLAAVDWLGRWLREDDGASEPPAAHRYRHQAACFGRHTCFHAVVKGLKGLAEVPDDQRSPAVRRRIRSAVEFMLRHRVFRSSRNPRRVGRPGWASFGFPRMWDTDALEILDILVRLGVRDDRMLEAVALVERKRGADGRWRLARSWNGRMHADIEQKGTPSRWVTLNARRALQRWYR